MAAENKELTKKVRGQIARRYVDSSQINVNCVGGVVYLTGILGMLRTAPGVELKAEMGTISQTLRAIQGVREVVWDVVLRT